MGRRRTKTKRFALPVVPVTRTPEQLLEENREYARYQADYRAPAGPTPVLNTQYIAALYRRNVTPLTTTRWGPKLDTVAEVNHRAWSELILPPAEAAFPPFSPAEAPPREQKWRPFGFGPVAAHLGLAMGRPPCDQRPAEAYIVRQVPFVWNNIRREILDGHFYLNGRVPCLGNAMKEVQRVSDLDLVGLEKGSVMHRFRCCLCEERELIIPGLQERSEAAPDGWEELVVSRMPNCSMKHVFGRECFEKYCFDIQPDGSKKPFCPVCRANGRYTCSRTSPFHLGEF